MAHLLEATPGEPTKVNKHRSLELFEFVVVFRFKQEISIKVGQIEKKIMSGVSKMKLYPPGKDHSEFYIFCFSKVRSILSPIGLKVYYNVKMQWIACCIACTPHHVL